MKTKRKSESKKETIVNRKEKEENKKDDAVKEYYEAESWQFSGCGD